MFKKILLLFIVFTNVTLIFSQNKIGLSKKELKTPPSSIQSKSANNITANNSNTTSNNFFDGTIQILSDITLGLVFGYKSSENHLQNYVSLYPYYNGKVGNYDPAEGNKKWRIDVENNFLISNENIFGNDFNVKLRPIEDFYLKINYKELIEKNKQLNNPNISLFNFSFCYDRLRFEKFNLGWNLGLNYVSNNINKAGLAFGLSTDIFISKEINFSSSINWSEINHQPVNSFDIKYKYFTKRFSINVGYQYLKIATPTYSFLSLGAGVSL